jgi:hypothetical protein
MAQKFVPTAEEFTPSSQNPLADTEAMIWPYPAHQFKDEEVEYWDDEAIAEGAEDQSVNDWYIHILVPFIHISQKARGKDDK